MITGAIIGAFYPHFASDGIHLRVRLERVLSATLLLLLETMYSIAKLRTSGFSESHWQL